MASVTAINNERLAPRFLLSQANRYRMRRLECLRFAVERWCRFEKRWLAVHIDDSPSRAFEEMRRCDGHVVCSRCGIILPDPRLEDDFVRCDHCLIYGDFGPMPWYFAVAAVVSVVFIVALRCGWLK